MDSGNSEDQGFPRSFFFFTPCDGQSVRQVGLGDRKASIDEREPPWDEGGVGGYFS